MPPPPTVIGERHHVFRSSDRPSVIRPSTSIRMTRHLLT